MAQRTSKTPPKAAKQAARAAVPQGPATGPQVASIERKRRVRFGPLPKPDPRADLYWGVSQPELAGVNDGKLAHLILTSPEFEVVFGAKLDAIDGRNKTMRATAGRPARWSARQMEALLIYRRVSGLTTVKRTRERLLTDTEAQLLLGLGGSIPSAPTITRHLTKWFDKGERRDLYLELDKKLRQRVFQLEGFDDESRKLAIDGSQHGTHFTPPLPEVDANKKLTGRIRNAKIPAGGRGAITAPDAGIVGGSGPKSGRGWQFVGLFSEHGTLLGWDISALNLAEYDAAERVLSSYASEALPHRDPKTISVLTADGGFNSAKLRRQLQDLRIAPNIHKASHGDSERSEENVARLNGRWEPFAHPSKRHYRNWGANGHSEISCQCGAGTTERVYQIGKAGGLSIATRGNCDSCGNVTITSGKWRRSRNPNKYVLALDGGDDPSVGNSLTFNDPMAREYGQDRFGWNESIHATLMRRFGLLKQSWMRSKTEVETEFAIAASGISVLLLERARRKTQLAAQAARPVGQVQAA
jgi:hypothetical protein